MQALSLWHAAKITYNKKKITDIKMLALVLNHTKTTAMGCLDCTKCDSTASGHPAEDIQIKLNPLTNSKNVITKSCFLIG